MEINKNELNNEEFEKRKYKLIEELKLEISSVQEGMYSLEIGSNEYNKVLNKFNILNKELGIVQSLTFNNMDSKNENFSYLKTYYGFLSSLSDVEINIFLKILEEYQNSDFFTISKDVNFPDILLQEKEAMLNRNMKVDSLDNIGEIQSIITMLDLQKQNLLKYIDTLDHKYSQLISSDFTEFYDNCRYGKISDNKLLIGLKTYPSVEKFIDKIIYMKEEVKKLSGSFIGRYKFVEKRENVLTLQQHLLDSISSYINYSFDIIIEEIDNKERINTKDVFKKYFKIMSLIRQKIKSIDELKLDLSTYYNKYINFEKLLLQALKPYSIKDREDIEKVKDLDRDRVNTLIAKIEVYDKMNGEKLKQDDEDRSLVKVNND